MGTGYIVVTQELRRNMSYWRFIPNLITLLRFAAVPLLVWWLLDKQFQNALLLCLLMGASDALDGFLARAFDWKTTLGSYLDPAADKVMLISAYVALGILDLLPHWLVFIVIIRDVVLLAGAVSYVSSTRRFDIKPSLISKFNTFIQILLVLAVIFSQVNNFPAVIIQILIGLTLCTTIASGYDYFIAERSRRASNQSSKQA